MADVDGEDDSTFFSHAPEDIKLLLEVVEVLEAWRKRSDKLGALAALALAKLEEE